ncbi:MAG: hypothetical protein A3I00_08835 [Betaproteobacteria bacterium RIFCSPLOWO2_02_FULL_64_12]|nr:MAG: hypothetical protein A3I00_08835 [Betaproteobacteria bacterium RIFCSPLOWO2_02_FULL_64_12]
MTTVADVAPLHDLLASLEPGAPLTHGALTVVPLLAPTGPEPDWLTLAEAGEAVTITEVGEGGSVPHLTVTNAGDRPVLLLEGEELLGAKQNRVLNTTVLVAAGATLTIPVSCVEQGRWAWRGRGFASSDAALFATLRARKVARVSASLRRGAGHQADQGEVWREIDGLAAQYGVESPTGAMHDVYESRADEIGKARKALTARPGQIGALVYLCGRWLGLDLLATPGLFERAWPRLCAGYAAEAVGTEPDGAVTLAPERLLKGLARVPTEAAAAVGLGREYRLGSRTAQGAALVVDDRVAHLMAFPVSMRH